MRELIKKTVRQEFPELAGGYHLPRMAQVLAIADAPADGDVADDFWPCYAVDLQVLDMHGNPDSSAPTLHAVPLPTAVCGGAEMGQFGFPQRGTLVLLQFAYGSVNKPAITAIYPHGGAMPACSEGEMVTQQRAGVQHRIDGAGNITRETDGKTHDISQDYLQEAFSSTVKLHQEAIEVEGNSTRTVKGGWVNRVLGAFRLAVGGSLNLSSADNMAMTTASDLNINVARNLAQAVKNNASLVAKMLEQTLDETAKMTAGTSVHFEAPECYIGDSSNNLFKMVSDLAQATIDLANAVAAHTHLYIPGVLPPIATAVPNNAATATTVATDASTAKGKVDAMTGT